MSTFRLERPCSKCTRMGAHLRYRLFVEEHGLLRDFQVNLLCLCLEQLDQHVAFHARGRCECDTPLSRFRYLGID